MKKKSADRDQMKEILPRDSCLLESIIKELFAKFSLRLLAVRMSEYVSV
jgi:hypothetical protein